MKLIRRILFFCALTCVVFSYAPQAFATSVILSSHVPGAEYSYKVGDSFSVIGSVFRSYSYEYEGRYSIINMDTSMTVNSGSLGSNSFQVGVNTTSLAAGRYKVYLSAAEFKTVMSLMRDSSGNYSYVYTRQSYGSATSQFYFTLTSVPKVCTISYVLGGGVFFSSPTYSYTEGEYYSLPSPYRSGYTFDGWYTSSSFSGSRVYSIGTSDTGDKTYYAKWTPQIVETPQTCEIFLDGNGGSESGPRTYAYGKGYTLPSPYRSGYIFDGWYASSSFAGSRVYSIGTSDTGNKTYYAKWTPQTYEINLVGNGGSETGLRTYAYGSGYSLPWSYRSGYIFDGWYESSDFVGSWVYRISTSDMGTKTYYAKWKPQTYEINLIGNGGSASGLGTYVYGIGYVLPTPIRDCYTFMGWYESPDFTGSRVYGVSTSDLGDKTYYSCWYSNSNYLTSMYKSTGTWSRAWSKTRTSNTLTLSRSKSSVRLKASISSKSKVYFKYAGHSYSNVTGMTKTIKVSRGHKKTIYFKVVSQSGQSRTYKIVVKRRS